MTFNYIVFYTSLGAMGTVDLARRKRITSTNNLRGIGDLIERKFDLTSVCVTNYKLVSIQKDEPIA